MTLDDVIAASVWDLLRKSERLIKYQGNQIMAANGGVRPGAGRPKGAANKKTRELQAAAEASGIMPLEYMLNIMRDATGDPEMRFEAAKAAAPYVHAKLVASTNTTELKGGLTIETGVPRAG
jgi:hypothetical protein